MKNRFLRSETFFTFRRCLIMAVTALLLLSVSSCGESPSIAGNWRLVEYCYGTDCLLLDNHDILQTWELSDKAVDADFKTDVMMDCHLGRQYQEGVMDDNVAWGINEDGDSLYVFNMDGECLDIFYVTEFEKDTLVLSSMVNNILIRQRFVRQ